jgi:DNA-binding winged helix-turn-helix (wHTH) protein/tetratricopeptide (TPR) repeat protein
VLDRRTRELRGGGRRIRLGEKPFLVLAALLERPGELVTREELRHRLWAEDTVVDFDNNLNSAVTMLRRALGDPARTRRFIETLPRLGYRFTETVEPVAEPFPAPPATPAGRLASHGGWSLGLIGSALAGVLVWAGAQRLLRSPARPASVLTGPRAAVAAENGDYRDGVDLLERGDPGSLRLASERLRRATESDPGHAAAHAALGEAWVRLTLHRLAPQPEGFTIAEGPSLRAIELDPKLATAHRSLAMIRLHRDWDFEAAARESAQAVRADPADASSHLVMASVEAASGRMEAAVAAARRAIRVDPGRWRVRADLAFFLLAADRPEEAMAESRSVLALEPGSAVVLDLLLTASERVGRLELAREAAIRLMEIAKAPPGEIRSVREAAPAEGVRRYRGWQVRLLEENALRRGWPPTTMASIYASAGRVEEALRWLRFAYDQRDPMLVSLAANPDLASMRWDPRFAELVRLVGVPAGANRS